MNMKSLAVAASLGITAGGAQAQEIVVPKDGISWKQYEAITERNIGEIGKILLPDSLQYFRSHGDTNDRHTIGTTVARFNLGETPVDVNLGLFYSRTAGILNQGGSKELGGQIMLSIPFR